MANNKKITQEQLKSILAQHKKWLADNTKGKRADLANTNLRCVDLIDANLSKADLSGADLYKADLRSVNLSGADLRGADLEDADLRGVNLYEACLPGAILAGANLSRADLAHADLTKAVLSHADLEQADLSNAHLQDAYLHGTKLVGANLAGTHGLATVRCDIFTAGFRLTPPATGEYVAWKSARRHIIKLLIPSSAKRSSATTRMCRASKAKVLGIYTLKGELAKKTTVYSDYDESFAYKVGETVSVPDFNPDRWVEWAPGIHHFLTMEEAIDWAK